MISVADAMNMLNQVATGVRDKMHVNIPAPEHLAECKESAPRLALLAIEGYKDIVRTLRSQGHNVKFTAADSLDRLAELAQSTHGNDETTALAAKYKVECCHLTVVLSPRTGGDVVLCISFDWPLHVAAVQSPFALTPLFKGVMLRVFRSIIGSPDVRVPVNGNTAPIRFYDSFAPRWLENPHDRYGKCLLENPHDACKRYVVGKGWELVGCWNDKDMDIHALVWIASRLVHVRWIKRSRLIDFKCGDYRTEYELDLAVPLARDYTAHAIAFGQLYLRREPECPLSLDLVDRIMRMSLGVE
jgi:hypothetical protein